MVTRWLYTKTLWNMWHAGMYASITNRTTVMQAIADILPRLKAQAKAEREQLTKEIAERKERRSRR